MLGRGSPFGPERSFANVPFSCTGACEAAGGMPNPNSPDIEFGPGTPPAARRCAAHCRRTPRRADRSAARPARPGDGSVSGARRRVGRAGPLHRSHARRVQAAAPGPRPQRPIPTAAGVRALRPASAMPCARFVRTAPSVKARSGHAGRGSDIGRGGARHAQASLRAHTQACKGPHRKRTLKFRSGPTADVDSMRFMHRETGNDR